MVENLRPIERHKLSETIKITKLKTIYLCVKIHVPVCKKIHDLCVYMYMCIYIYVYMYIYI